ncbi:MAG: hypothetical protein AAFO07_18740, partial [Bacteroidota bacterium]
MNQLSFQYPTWFILLCIALGVGYALALYLRDKTFRQQAQRLNLILGILRFFLVTIIAILLLSPFLKFFSSKIQKPIVVVAQDASESIRESMSEEELTAFKTSLSNLSEDLSKKYDVVNLSYGERVREGLDEEFADKITNTSDLFTYINDQYTGENVGAIILTTDGIYNQGSNPLYQNMQVTAPLYTVALGDTSIKKDVILKRAFNNRIAYLNDRFAVLVDVAAQNSKGSSTLLSIYRVSGSGTQKIEERVIDIDDDDFFRTEEIVLDADKAGVQRFRVSLRPINGEVTTGNNSKDIFIDILDARQKILLLAHAPHPDVTAFKQSITSNKNYQLEVAYADNYSGYLVEYDFVILHQLPSITSGISPILAQLKEKYIPHFFIVGSQTDLNQFSKAQDLIEIRGDGRNFDEVQGRLNGSFTLFTFDERISQQLADFAPLVAPFGEYTVNEAAQVLLYQRISKIDTENPLLVFGENNGSKVGVLAAEGIWKWRLFDFLQNQTHDIIDELVGKSVQYVSVKEDKRRFRVTPEKNIFDENERILINAELYNNSYELVNDPDV